MARYGSTERLEVGAVVLAGGEGSRLRPLTRRITGRDVPKQFCPILGSTPLLDQTRQRIAHTFPERATVTIVTRSHERFYEPLLNAVPLESALVQPANRGVGAGPAILYGILRIAERNPAATIAVFPSNHYVSDDVPFMRHVELAMRAVQDWPRMVVLFGAVPNAPEVSYCWIEERTPLTCSGPGLHVYTVGQFWEKPSLDVARMLLDRDLTWWNTFVMVAQLTTLLELFVKALPKIYITFLEATSRFSARLNGDSLERLYDKLSSTNFSDHVLARHPES